MDHQQAFLAAMCRGVFGGVAVMFACLGATSTVRGQDDSAKSGADTSGFEATERAAVDATVEKSIEYWVEQLGHEHYLRREIASKKLVAEGPAAVDNLALAVRSGDLEVVERATAAIVEIAISHAPRKDGGAYEQLDNLATRTIGRPASRALSAMHEVRLHRYGQAREALSKAGISVGMKAFAIGAISQPRMLVQIDAGWNGDRESLQWLAWLDGVENARISGAAVIPEVIERVTEIPDVRSIAIVDATMSDAAIEPLTKMDRIDSLDFRYVKLTEGQGDMISAIPLRRSLNLMGTGISAQKVGSLRSALPGLQIDHRKGGFLGVTCIDNFDVCEINGILPASAAEEAGLIKGDIIVQIGESSVQHFRDLQKAINQHVPGDEIDVQFRRGDKIESVKLRLRRFEET